MDLLQCLKALAEKTRLKILAMLMDKEFCVEALANRLDLSESAVSQHLRILREAGMVEGTKRSYYVHYSVKEERLADIIKALENLPEHVVIPDTCQSENCQRDDS